MSSLSLARSIGGVGSILVLFSFILSDGAALFVAGLILILIAANNLASVTKGRELKGNIQAAVALYGIGTIIAFIFVYMGFPSFIGSGFTGPLTSADPLATFFARFAGTRVIGLFATWFFFVVASFYLKKTYDSNSAQSQSRPVQDDRNRASDRLSFVDSFRCRTGRSFSRRHSADSCVPVPWRGKRAVTHWCAN